MDKFKLQWKIFAFIISFCTLLVIILWLFQTVFLRHMYKMIRTSEIEKAIVLVEENIDNPDLQSIINELDLSKEIFVSSDIINDKPPIRYDMDNHKKPKMETITAERVFTKQNGEKIHLAFRAVITPVEATISTLHMQLIIITVIMLFLSIIFALAIARIISKPIVELNKSAKLLADGDYSTEFSGRGFLEIAELSNTLNITAVELSKNEALRHELMANISHDLRTPLALIYSYAEMMHDFPNEISSEQTQTIMNEVSRLSSLVNDIMDVSKLESGVFEVNKSNFNITQSINTVVKRMSELLKKEGYTLTFEFSEDFYLVADEVKIIQAFYNLLINAINYTGKNKEVLVKQSLFDNNIKLEVIDYGDGISEENLPYIWDRYYKSDKKHKRAIVGTGLGLSIVKKIITFHKGSYGVESTLGKGSVFWFLLPI